MRIIWAVAWPLLIAVAPFVVMALLPDSALAELAVVFLAPMFAALIRAATAGRVWKRNGIATPGFWRSAAYAAAVALLMLFEGLMAVVAVSEQKPPFDWWAWAAWFYAGYIGMMRLAVLGGCATVEPDDAPDAASELAG